MADVLNGADLLDETELRGIAESVRENSQSLSAFHGRVDGLESKLTEVNGIGANLQATVKQGIDSATHEIRTVQGELKGIRESSDSNSHSLSGIHSRVDAPESKSTELMSVVGTLQSAMDQGLDSLNEGIKSVHADVKTPIIVKRFF